MEFRKDEKKQEGDKKAERKFAAEWLRGTPMFKMYPEFFDVSIQGVYCREYRISPITGRWQRYSKYIPFDDMNFEDKFLNWCGGIEATVEARKKMKEDQNKLLGVKPREVKA